MNGRIERNLTPREDFLVEMFQDDPRLVEELNKNQGFNWQFMLVLLVDLGAIIAIIWGVVRAIDKGQI